MQRTITEFIQQYCVGQAKDILVEAKVNGLMIDLFLKKYNVVIQIDGPSHFLHSLDTTSPRQPMIKPESIHQEKLLAHMHVIHLRYDDWKQLKEDHTKLEWLQARVVSRNGGALLGKDKRKLKEGPPPPGSPVVSKVGVQKRSLVVAGKTFAEAINVASTRPSASSAS